jgi:hypothetical protein
MEEVVDAGRHEPALTAGIPDANFAGIPGRRAETTDSV